MNAEQIKEELDKINNSIEYIQKKEKEKYIIVKNEIDKIKEAFLSQNAPGRYEIYHTVDVNVCPSLLKKELNKLGFGVDGIETIVEHDHILDLKNIVGYDFLIKRRKDFNKWIDKDVLDRIRSNNIMLNVFEKACRLRGYYSSEKDGIRLIDLLIDTERNLLRESFLYKFDRHRFQETVVSMGDHFLVMKYLIKIYIPNVPLLTLDEYKLKLEELRIEVDKIYRINIPQENESNKKGFWSKIFK